MKEYTIKLTEDQIEALTEGDYNEVEDVIANIIAQVREQQKE